MAKSKSYHTTKTLPSDLNSPSIRVVTVNTSLPVKLYRPPPLTLPKLSPLLFQTPVRKSVLRLEDRRAWHPDKTVYRKIPSPAAAASPRSGALLKLSPRRLMHPGSLLRLPNISDLIGFRTPGRVAICVRRRIRKEIMHALGKAGKGHKRPRHNAFSKVKC